MSTIDLLHVTKCISDTLLSSHSSLEMYTNYLSQETEIYQTSQKKLGYVTLHLLGWNIIKKILNKCIVEGNHFIYDTSCVMTLTYLKLFSIRIHVSIFTILTIGISFKISNSLCFYDFIYKHHCLFYKSSFF